MKHIFYICNTAADTLGLEKILTFYNVIVLEQTDGLEDFSYSGNNIFYANDLSSTTLKEFVDDLSYYETPLIFSNDLTVGQKLKDLYGWDVKEFNFYKASQNDNNSLIFNIFKSQDNIIFSNIHRYFLIDYNNYSIEILDWSENFIDKINPLIKNINDLSDGFNTVICNINEDYTISIKRVVNNSISIGIDTFTRQQIKDNETPFILNNFYNDLEKEDTLNFNEGFQIQNPKSQNKSFPLTKINIKTKYENQIKNDFPSGVWKYGGDNTGKIEHECLAIYPIDEDGDKTLCLIKRGYSIYDVEGMEGFIINTKMKDVKLNADDIFASISMSFSVLNKNNELYGWVLEVINALLRYQMKESKIGI